MMRNAIVGFVNVMLLYTIVGTSAYIVWYCARIVAR